VEINNEALAAAPELRRHFRSDEEIHQFAARMVSQSRNALRHVYAMKRLGAEFSPDELRSLTPEAKSKWLGLIRAHALAYRNEAEGLRYELQPIFFPNAASGAGETGAAIMDDASLVRAIDQLFAVASANDAVIRAAFATSSGTVSTSAVGSPQFARSLLNAETLAARISKP
jgi:hypothetical protein